MNIFISWSGDRSHRVAKLLKTWIKGVIQASRPWISSTDISSGTIWFTEIIKQLDATTQGIICLTNENKEKPWILFEAGALANSGIESSRVYTLLIDVDQKDVQPPLSQFNLTKPDEESMLKLMTDINSTLTEDVRLEKEVLERSFKVYWTEFKADFDKAIANSKSLSHTQPSASRTDNEILSEILDTVRGLNKRVGQLEELLDSKLSENDYYIPDTSSYDTSWKGSADMLNQIVSIIREDDQASDNIIAHMISGLYPTISYKQIGLAIQRVRSDMKKKLIRNNKPSTNTD